MTAEALALFDHALDYGRVEKERTRERRRAEDVLFLPPGCSSENVVTSYTFPFAIIHNDSFVLWVETSVIEYLGYVFGAGSFDTGVMKTGVLVLAAGIV